MEFTQATRNLCAGAYLDSKFAQRVLLRAYSDRNRHIAPSYGFDVAQVALHARRAWWIDVVQHAALIVAVVLVRPSVVAVVVAGGVLVLWHAVGEVIRLVFSFLGYLRDRRSISEFVQFRVRIVVILLEVGVAAAVVVLSLILTVGFGPVSALWRGGDLRPVREVGGSAVKIVLLAMAVVLGAAALRQWAARAVLRPGGPPLPMLNRRMQHLELEQHSQVTVYSGFHPFVGSGEEFATWSLIQRLLRCPETSGNPVPAARPDLVDDIDIDLDEPARSESERDREIRDLPFTSDALMERIRSELLRLRNADEEVNLPGLEVDDHIFVTESYADTFAKDPDNEARKVTVSPTGPARRYLACTVEAWGGEIVTSVFVSASLQGKMLHLEFSVWGLLPTRPDFHVGELSGRRAARWHVGRALQRLRDLPDEVGRLPGDLWTAVPLAARAVASLGATGPWLGSRNCGARFSVREDGAINRYVAVIAAARPADLVATQHRRVLLIEEKEPKAERAALRAVRDAERLTRQAARAVNYFQMRDIERHWKVLERRVIAAVLDMLEEKGIDTTEYRARATQILNNYGNIFNGPANIGNLHQGRGDIVQTEQAGTASGAS